MSLIPILLGSLLLPQGHGQPTVPSQEPSTQEPSGTLAPKGRQAPSASQASDKRLSRLSRRVLHLADGRRIQALAAWKDGHWEVRQGKRLSKLPKSAVLDAPLEREVIKAWEQAGKTTEASAQPQCEHVRAGFEAGLLTQSLKALEEVLETYPVDRGPVALVAEFGDSVQRPRLAMGAALDDEQAETIASWAAKGGALARELAIIELAKSADRTALKDRLERWLEQGSPQRRAFAAHALRRLAPRDKTRQLMRRAVLDGSEQVRSQAALALAAAHDEALVLPVSRALSSSHPSVRTRAASSLATMGYAAAVPALVARLAQASSGISGGGRVPHQHIYVGTQSAYIQDFDVEVANNASIADPVVNTLVEGIVLDVAVHSVQIQQVLRHEQRVLVRSLQDLTGEKVGHRAKDWSAWYERNRARFEERGTPSPKR